jgi:hypothetical protein
MLPIKVMGTEMVYADIIFFCRGSTALSGPGPPHCRGFTIIPEDTP